MTSANTRFFSSEALWVLLSNATMSLSISFKFPEISFSLTITSVRSAVFEASFFADAALIRCASPRARSIAKSNSLISSFCRARFSVRRVRRRVATAISAFNLLVFSATLVFSLTKATSSV